MSKRISHNLGTFSQNTSKEKTVAVRLFLIPEKVYKLDNEDFRVCAKCFKAYPLAKKYGTFHMCKDKELEIAKHECFNPNDPTTCGGCTKSQTQHTPTPLKVGDVYYEGSEAFRRIDGPDGLLVALVSDRNLKDTTLRDNDAARFVRAVNSHEALLKIATDAISGKWCPTCGRNNSLHEEVCTSDDCPAVQAIKQAEAGA